MTAPTHPEGPLVAALRELVALKDLSDREGLNVRGYYERKRLAWEAARRALAEYEAQPIEPDRRWIGSLHVAKSETQNRWVVEFEPIEDHELTDGSYPVFVGIWTQKEIAECRERAKELAQHIKWE